MKNTTPRHASGMKIKEASKAMPILTTGLATIVASAALASPAIAATPNGDGSFKVASGDTLSQIAQQFGDGNWSKWKGYRSGDPNLIYPGENVRPDEAPVATSSDVRELAQRVIGGEFGNGQARKDALGAQYDAVQAVVNELLGAGVVTPAGSTSVNPVVQSSSQRTPSKQWVIDKAAWDESVVTPEHEETVHHPALTHEVEHPAVTHTEIVNHPATTKVVRHPAVTHQETVPAVTHEETVPAVTHQVYHPAVTEERTVHHVKYVFEDGYIANSLEEYDRYSDTHPLVSSYNASYDTTETVVVREAWSETVVDVPAHQRTVVDVPAYQRTIVDKEAWEETMDVPAWSETITVTDKPAWKQTVVDKPAWDEQVRVPASTRVVHHPAQGHWA